MLVFSWLPIALLGVVILMVGLVSLGVAVVERRRLARNAAALPRRRRFRPVVIQGGRAPAPAMEAAAGAAADMDKLAG